MEPEDSTEKLNTAPGIQICGHCGGETTTRYSTCEHCGFSVEAEPLEPVTVDEVLEKVDNVGISPSCALRLLLPIIIIGGFMLAGWLQSRFNLDLVLPHATDLALSFALAFPGGLLGATIFQLLARYRPGFVEEKSRLRREWSWVFARAGLGVITGLIRWLLIVLGLLEAPERVKLPPL